MSRQNEPPGPSTRSMGNVFSHSFMRVRLLFWTTVMKCSTDPGESSSATRMNSGSGSMTICWLSFLPVSVPNGCDSASAAV
jgi:hypothetical protein